MQDERVEALRSISESSVCQRCHRAIGDIRFLLGGETRCPRCALYYTPTLRRSFFTALVVGTFLTAINQGDILVHGAFPAELYWKIPLTFSVPFCVATWGALGNAVRRAPASST